MHKKEKIKIGVAFLLFLISSSAFAQCDTDDVYVISLKIRSGSRAEAIRLFESVANEYRRLDYPNMSGTTYPSGTDTSISGVHRCITIPKQSPLTDEEILKLREKIIGGTK